MNHRSLLIALAALPALLIPICAQESRGTIVGRITDQSGAIIPSATVEVTNKAQGLKTAITTNDAGIYQAAYLTPGTYQVAVSASGFKKAVRETVNVNVGDRINVDFTLEIGGTDQSITVTAETPLLETATASMGQVVDTKRIAELPIAHGQPFALIGLSSGVAYTGSATLDRPFEPTHIVGYSMNGTRGNRSDVTIDGIPSTSTANANEVIASYVPPQDIVQEFKVQTATFDAQSGNTEGGVTNISIKSGTNDLHGSAYFYKMSPQLFANNWFANANRQPRTEFDYNRLGGYISGPILIPKLYNGRNRTFFLYGPEGIRESRPRNNGVGTTLTDANRTGDFSALLALGAQYQIYNPYTRRQTAPGVFTSDPFPNNQIPVNLINPVSKALLQYWPKPLAAGLPDGRQNLVDPNLLETAKYFNHTIRLDHSLSDTQRLSYRWSSYDRDSDYNNYFGNLATGEHFQFVSRATSLDYVKTLSATKVLNVRYGYNRFIRVTANNPGSDGFDLSQVGFAKTYADQIPESVRSFPGIAMNVGTSGTAAYQGTNQGGEYRPTDTHALMATLNQTLGTHAVKYGTEFRAYRENAVFNGNDTVGRFTFNSLYTRRDSNSNATDSPNGLGQSAAAFLLGLPSNATVLRTSYYNEQSTSWGFFFQDDWRVSSRLTLNLGLRYEVETPLEDRYGRSIKGFDPDATVTYNGRTYRGAFTIPEGDSGLYKTPKNNFLPRFGFAYRLGQKTVLRGGYGIFYGFLGQRRGDVIRSGFSRTTDLPASADGGLTFTRSLSNLFTDPLLEPPPAAQIPSTLVGTSSAFFNQNPKTPQNQRWQFGAQHEFFDKVLVEASYVGNRGTRIEITRDVNALARQYWSASPVRDQANISFLEGQIPNPNAGVLPGTGVYNNANYERYRSLRPYPYYGDLNTSTNQGYSWYHSLQVNVQKRFSQGYTLQAGWTWSKYMEAVQYLNASDPMPVEAIAPADRTHRFVVSGIYELPFGKGKAFANSANPVLSRIVGGWQLNGIFTYQSGAPIEFGNVIFNGAFSDLPLKNRSVERWFNTEAGFNRVAAQQLAWNLRTFPLRLGNLRTDAMNNLDFSVIKNTRITEGKDIQLRAEALNATNTPIFAAPDTAPTGANFGRVTGVSNYARRIQLGLRFVF